MGSMYRSVISVWEKASVEKEATTIMKIWQKRIKRTMDVFGAVIGFVFLSPVLMIVAVLIWVTMGRPVLFRQRRPGFHGKPFEMLKFRTMRPPRHGEEAALTDAKRLTNLGRLLRKTSLDELPELWNVLRGEMSLVGPRPLLMHYLPYFTERELCRHNMRPGITGWAQINGRNTASWDERLENDIWYLENWSLWLDLRIVLATIKFSCLSKNVVTDPRRTMKNLDEERANVDHKTSVVEHQADRQYGSQHSAKPHSYTTTFQPSVRNDDSHE